MDEKTLVPLVTGLVGALIGGGFSMAGVMIQARLQARKERLRMMLDAAIEDHRGIRDLAKSAGRDATIPPLSIYLFHYRELLDLIERGDFNAENYRALMARQKSVYSTITELSDE